MCQRRIELGERLEQCAGSIQKETNVSFRHKKWIVLNLMGTKPKIRISRFFLGFLTKIIKRGEVSQQIRIDKVMQNGGFWLSIGSTAGHENGISFADFIDTRPS